MCIDYQALNKVTIKNIYMLLMLDDLLQELEFLERVLKGKGSKKIQAIHE